MYNDTLKVANKIITSEDLLDIFNMMNEKLTYYRRIYQTEYMQNQRLEYSYQRWTFEDKSNNSCLTFEVNFTDDTNIKFDNYNNFVSIYNNRLHEIKNIYVHFSLIYSTRDMSGEYRNYTQRINMSVYSNKMDIDASLSSEDKKIDDVYELIKNKILNAPEKYDEVIRKKRKINTIVGLALGFIPSLILTTILIFVPTIRVVYASSYILYPIANIVLAFIIGGTLSSFKLDRLYSTISPEKKYVRYDTTNHRSVYEDDIDNFVDTSEILIGKNVDNMKCREKIMACYLKYKKYIPIELIIVAVISIIIILLGSE